MAPIAAGLSRILLDTLIAEGSIRRSWRSATEPADQGAFRRPLSFAGFTLFHRDGTSRHRWRDQTRRGAGAQTRIVFVVNGDTYVEVDYRAMLAAHREASASLSIAVHAVPDASRYGALDIDVGSCAGSSRRAAPGPGSINAGVYLLARDLLDKLHATPLVLVRSGLPHAPGRGNSGRSLSKPMGPSSISACRRITRALSNCSDPRCHRSNGCVPKP